MEKYKKKYPIACQIFENSLKEDKLSHAYLLESKEKDLDFAISLAKFFLYKNDSQVIDLKIIKPDGLFIKKNQIEELQNEFKNSSLLNEKKVYIIYECDKLNIHAANSMLKFLEEPENNIIAILLTDNANSVLNTIKSRCMIITLENQIQTNNLENYLTQQYQLEKENIIKIIDKSLEFISIYETKKINVLTETNEILKEIKTKEQLLAFFEILILIYKDYLNKNLNIPLEFFEEELFQLEVKNISDKIIKILELKEQIYYNVNSSLLIDKLIIDLDGIDKNE